MDTSNASVSGRRLAVLKSDLFDVTREEPGKAFEETVEVWKSGCRNQGNNS